MYHILLALEKARSKEHTLHVRNFVMIAVLLGVVIIRVCSA